ncbi:MAG: PAC2 family protein, partial [Propionibacteriaceae bacterium]|nr:PAC2 family protein [Propionibacteriaceae bacterium]
MGRFNLRRPVAVIAFSGWNDAGEAASAVVEHLCERYHCERFAALDPEKYYDFQVSRPCALRDED